ncbi:hypothetical protein AK812_SmicGene5435 [Symbiodinium microadriaticum]|uniref:Ubiquitin-like domain-containing protein n=1 Tax=Symbiodinium microadriaticum TaxID=2951 RepID=A0A1Q9ETR0_SYMMI|nr:hypothetical protein AK812_SmicGene5435 [Symbiodinium microadriaticum]
MLRVYMVSGDELAAIPVATVSDVRELKQQLQKHCGVPRFRQRLLRNGLEAGADHDPPSRNLGRTPLHMAVDNGHASVVELLMDAGNATILHALQDQEIGCQLLLATFGAKRATPIAYVAPAVLLELDDLRLDDQCMRATEETEPLALSPEVTANKQLVDQEALAEVVLGSVCLECDLNFASYATSLGDVVSVKQSDPNLVWLDQRPGLAKAAEVDPLRVAMEKKRERADAQLGKKKD